MKHTGQVQLVHRVLSHLEHKTTDTSGAPHHQPVAAYADPAVPAVLNPGRGGTYTVPLSIPAYLGIPGSPRIAGYVNATPVD